MAKNKVIFGPWIGELGWELTSWQGWVRRVAFEDYRDYEKYVISFPGRECLYEGIDCTYLSNPKWFCDLGYSPRAFATDYWTQDGPKLKETYRGPIMKPKAKELLMYFSNKLNVDTKRFIVPWKTYPYKNITIGGILKNNFVPTNIPFNMQKIIRICPDRFSLNSLNSIMTDQGFDTSSPMVSIFPRGRLKNANKNWSEKYYRKLVDFLKSEFPKFVISFIGSPDGALFSKRVPSDILNLIDIPVENMLNIHVAAMSRSVIGIGPASGILHVAAFVGMPFISDLGHKEFTKLHRKFSVKFNPFGCKMFLFKKTPDFNIISVHIKEILCV